MYHEEDGNVLDIRNGVKRFLTSGSSNRPVQEKAGWISNLNRLEGNTPTPR